MFSNQQKNSNIFYTIFFTSVLFAIAVTYYELYVQQNFTHLEPTIFESEE